MSHFFSHCYLTGSLSQGQLSLVFISNARLLPLLLIFPLPFQLWSSSCCASVTLSIGCSNTASWEWAADIDCPISTYMYNHEHLNQKFMHVSTDFFFHNKMFWTRRHLSTHRLHSFCCTLFCYTDTLPSVWWASYQWIAGIILVFCYYNNGISCGAYKGTKWTV